MLQGVFIIIILLSLIWIPTYPDISGHYECVMGLNVVSYSNIFCSFSEMLSFAKGTLHIDVAQSRRCAGNIACE